MGCYRGQAHTPSKRCNECNFVHFKEKYQPMQWARKDKLSVCRTCIEAKKQSGTPFRCNNCGLWKEEGCFPSHYPHGMRLLSRVCVDCMERRACDECGEYKHEEEFTPFQWKRAAWLASLSKCKKCMTRNRDMKFNEDVHRHLRSRIATVSFHQAHVGACSTQMQRLYAAEAD